MIGIFCKMYLYLSEILINILIVSYLLFSGLISFGLFYTLKNTIGIRVDETEEEVGLDLVEHGCSAYNGSTGTASAFNI